jgi:homoserine kinase
VIVRVPASSANLGPGFDTLGMALSLHVEMGVLDDTGVPQGARAIDQHHPASVAFRRAGGDGALWERSSVPAGRGLGFSGAMRAGGAVLARALAEGVTEVDDTLRAEVLPLVTELEGHADNVAASLYGGVVATGAGRVVRVPLALDPAVVVWVPSFVTKTDESRKVLATAVALDDVVFNLGRLAMLVAALAGGDVEALRVATDDRIHQPARLAAAAPSAAAIAAAVEAGAWCSWLSGSGPTVASLCSVADAEDVVAALPADGHAKVLRIDHEGTAIEIPYR